MSARLGKGFKGESLILRRPLVSPGNWFIRALREFIETIARQGVFKRRRRDAYTIYLAPRDEAGAQAMSELRDRGLSLAANALAKSVEHIESFFRMLQTELAFYIGCLNLHERLLALGAPFAYPSVGPPEAPRFSCSDLYDVCLALSISKRPVGNDIRADGKTLDHRHGGQSGRQDNIPRSLGVAVLMAESGMFVAADRLDLSLADGLFTHFKREEDASMKSGKFDEELVRMSAIVDSSRRTR